MSSLERFSSGSFFWPFSPGGIFCVATVFRYSITGKEEMFANAAPAFFSSPLSFFLKTRLFWRGLGIFWLALHFLPSGLFFRSYFYGFVLFFYF
jgi:hypothetical protein